MHAGETGATNIWREPKFGAKVELVDMISGASRMLYQGHSSRRNIRRELEVIPRAKPEAWRRAQVLSYTEGMAGGCDVRRKPRVLIASLDGRWSKRRKPRVQPESGRRMQSLADLRDHQDMRRQGPRSLAFPIFGR